MKCQECDRVAGWQIVHFKGGFAGLAYATSEPLAYACDDHKESVCASCTQKEGWSLVAFKA